jgi:predicted cupin superfamily sugar epimerase
MRTTPTWRAEVAQHTEGDWYACGGKSGGNAGSRHGGGIIMRSNVFGLYVLLTSSTFSAITLGSSGKLL